VRALIVESVGARGGLAGLRALKAAGWLVGVASPSRSSLAATSRWCSAWHPIDADTESAAAVLDGVERATRTGDYDVIFPTSDRDLLAISEQRDAFRAAFPYAQHETVVRALDKAELTSAARDAGISVPETTLDLEDGLARARGGAVVVKETLHRAFGGDGSSQAATLTREPSVARARAERIREQGGTPLFQEAVRGKLMAYTVVADQRGRPVARLQQRAERTWPADSGLSVRARTVAVEPALADSVERLMRSLEWFGLAELQFLESPGEDPRLIDLNGRFYGSLALAVDAGVNLPAAWAGLAVGEPMPPAPEARVGVRYQWLEGDLRRIREGPPSGRRRDYVDTLRWAVGARHSIWRLDDPRPAALSAADLIRSRLTRPSHEAESHES
jgi:predicted ATP-grasp superfamily ATP-dependent carboligase